jgi:hypothetical protein
MKYNEFHERTGWLAPKCSRNVKRGVLHPNNHGGPGHDAQYTEADVLVAQTLNALPASLTSQHAKAIADGVRSAFFDGRPTDYVIIHPPLVSTAKSAFEVERIISRYGESRTTLFTVVKPTNGGKS